MDDTIWEVVLSNDQIVSANDMSWLELATNIKNNKLKIKDLRLKFRSHTVSPFPKNAQGYYFSKACSGGMGSDSFNHFIIGILNGDHVERIWYYVPELEVYQKDIKHKDKVSKDGLIING